MVSTSNPATVLPTRAEVPVELTWDLSLVYADDNAWECDYQTLKRRYPELAAFRGSLRKSGKRLLAFFTLRDELYRLFYKLSVYATQKSDEDAANSTYQALKDRMWLLDGEISASLSFIYPELHSIKPDRLDSFLKEVPGLQVYRHELDELSLQRGHVRSPEVEALLAELDPVRGGAAHIYSVLSDADMRFPAIVCAGGAAQELTSGNYTARFLASHDRNERQHGFEAMMGQYRDLRHTMAALYSTAAQSEIFSARARRWQSTLEMSLGSIALPVAVYTSLIDTVGAGLPALHRYLDLRKRMLAVNELHMYDLYVPLVRGIDWKVTYQEAQELVLAAVAPLGREYVDALRAGYQSRWVDVVESRGKTSGAYAGGCYDTPPFMLLNWQNTLDSAYTLAHESGHAMHSWFSRKYQPFCYSNYTLFLAEVASTCNEALLTHYLLQVTTDRQKRRYIVNHALDEFRTTFFRQALFAEFEMEAFALAESGEALTADVLCGIYKCLNQRYYGSACVVDDLIENEWARVPHFFASPFYVYQYVTGMAAATALAQQIIAEGAPAVTRYLRLLSAGSSDYSMNLLRDAGVDLSTRAPVQQAINSFRAMLDQFEALL